MHFWIDKRSQGCGFRPQFLSVYGRNQRYIGGFHPKPMVTPIRRFQSLPPNINVRTHNVRNNVAQLNFNYEDTRRADMITSGQSHVPAPRRPDKPINKMNCFICFMCASFVILLPCAKYYFRFTFGVEFYIVSIFIFIGFLLVGLIYTYRSISASEVFDSPIRHAGERRVEEVTPPMSPAPDNPAEMPPPPYHIAIMLPDGLNSIRRDSPPPSYQKAVM